MAFTTTLFKALQSASSVICNGYEIDGFVYDVPGVVRLDCGESIVTYLPEQQIAVDDEGSASAVINEAAEDDDPVDLAFLMEIPMREADLLPDDPDYSKEGGTPL